MRGSATGVIAVTTDPYTGIRADDVIPYADVYGFSCVFCLLTHRGAVCNLD